MAQGQNQRHDGESLVMQQLLEHIEPAVRKAQARSLGGKDLTDACEEENAHTTVHETMRRSELLRRYASVGKFRMVAARYHLDSGGVERLPDRPLPAAPDQAAHLVPGAVRDRGRRRTSRCACCKPATGASSATVCRPRTSAPNAASSSRTASTRWRSC